MDASIISDIEPFCRRKSHIPSCFETRSDSGSLTDWYREDYWASRRDRWRLDIIVPASGTRPCRPHVLPVMSSRFEIAVEVSDPCCAA